MMISMDKAKSLPIFKMIVAVCIAIAVTWLGFRIHRWVGENRLLHQVIDRLSAESRIAEVLVTRTELDEKTSKIRTTIKFLEFDTHQQPMAPKYFTFEGNIIQFQSLVIRFEDKFVRGGDKLRGKSVYFFMKAFMLDGSRTQEFDITHENEIPGSYKVIGEKSEFEARLWKDFWNYALDPKARHRAGIKNAQIEAPGSLFLPGTIYTLHIEHDGGIRIDTQPIPEILKGEKV